MAEVDLEGNADGAPLPPPPPPPSPFFCNHLFFCDYFEELQTVLIKAKLIIDDTHMEELMLY